MYEHLDTHEYIRRMQEFDDERNFKVQETIEANWKPVGEPYVWECGLTAQVYQMEEEALKRIRGEV